MKLTAHILMTDYGSIIISTSNLTDLFPDYKLLGTHEFEFDDALIPKLNDVKTEMLVAKLEKLNSEHEKNRQKIIDELEGLKCQESKTLYSVI